MMKTPAHGEDMMKTQAHGEDMMKTQAHGEDMMKTQAHDEDMMKTQAHDEDMMKTQAHDEDSCPAAPALQPPAVVPDLHIFTALQLHTLPQVATSQGSSAEAWKNE
ncbi:hypothetical protein JOQ06_029782 [Pogonophryne albipinna]|uniref:Uncharacterized protein n=1 Tax=Pogonophryne albipinna TaxID=1090488 RepID=A0AAD6AVT4_9TELE|nr:hypothetical protein JOQ06_029782 [Pogonophryne albipinna]